MTSSPRYEELVEQFEDGLITQLRRHSVSLDYLEMWVPDPDPAKGILNLVEAAEAFGESEVSVAVGLDTLGESGVEPLREALAPMGDVSIDIADNAAVITVQFPEASE